MSSLLCVFWFTIFLEFTFSTTFQMLHRKRKDLQNGVVSEFKSLLEMLLEVSESNPEFTEEDIVDEVCTFMLAVGVILNNIHINGYSTYLNKK